jgi:adenylate cyclase, class 2
MRNIEYKAELRDLNLARSICRSLNAVHEGLLRQTDTYFKVADGRLKRRDTVGQPTEYIFYSRTNRVDPKVSHYVVYSEAEARERFGTSPLPIWVVVRKTRDLYLLDHVRIHLDDVDKLGKFLEFEAVVSDQNDPAACREAVEALRQAFTPVLGEAISVSYSDLLVAERNGSMDEPEED